VFTVRREIIKLALTSVLVAVSWVGTGSAASAALPDVQTMALRDLPPEGRDTYQLVHLGGPFPFEKDGVVFGNRERLLPRMSRGYYREYTVRTPMAHNRGARRLVCGGPTTRPDTCFYSSDHYASFRKVVP
jgi:ribonuclease T1